MFLIIEVLKRSLIVSITVLLSYYLVFAGFLSIFNYLKTRRIDVTRFIVLLRI